MGIALGGESGANVRNSDRLSPPALNDDWGHNADESVSKTRW